VASPLVIFSSIDHRRPGCSMMCRLLLSFCASDVHSFKTRLAVALAWSPAGAVTSARPEGTLSESRAAIQGTGQPFEGRCTLGTSIVPSLCQSGGSDGVGFTVHALVLVLWSCAASAMARVVQSLSRLWAVWV
jgi:hypothetical protein